MKETKKWKFKVASHANNHGLSDEQIAKVMDCYNHEEYQDFRNEMREKNKKYDQYPVAKWQLEKSDSIEKEWHDSLKFEIAGDKVTATVEFDVSKRQQENLIKNGYINIFYHLENVPLRNYMTYTT